MKTVRFRNPFSQALGLRFRKARPGTLYVFDFKRDVRAAFDMWFCFSPIDVFFLDARKRVVGERRGFAPWTKHRPGKRYRYAVETAPGVVRDPATLKKYL